jgi:hypothetical protein
MKHKDWLHPDHIILANSKKESIYKQFTKDMRSREYVLLRMLEINDNLYIRYSINNYAFWYPCIIMQQKGKDYYVLLNNTFTKGSDFEELEKKYIKFDREEKLNKLLR